MLRLVLITCLLGSTPGASLAAGSDDDDDRDATTAATPAGKPAAPKDATTDGSEDAADTDTAEPGSTCYAKTKLFSVPAGQTVEGDRYVIGQRARVEGTLDGDLFLLVESADLSGTVNDDVNGAASRITVSGKVGDDLRACAGEVGVSGEVAGDFLAAGGKVRVDPGARIGGRTLVGAGEAILSGVFEGPVHAGAGRVIFGGTAEGDVRIDADVIEFEDGARIKGNLRYTAREELEAFKGAGATSHQIVDGSVTFVPEAPKEKSGKRVHWLWESWTFATAFILGCLVIALARGAVRTVVQAAQNETLKSLGFGLLGHIFVPIAGVILLILCLTWPAGVLVLFLWWILFYMAKLVVSLALADGVMRRLGFSPSPYLALLVGMIPVWILFMVPVLGSLLYWFAVPIFGIGAILIGVRAYSARGQEPAAQPTGPAAPAPAV